MLFLFLVCSDHCDMDENKTLFQDYKERFILKRKKPLPTFTREMKLSFHVNAFSVASAKKAIAPSDDSNTDVDNDQEAIYGLQRIVIDGETYLIFYDGGCNKACHKHKAMLRLKSRAKQVVIGPKDLGGVGDIKLTTPHGEYRVELPMYNGRNASITGICLDAITNEMPTYPLNTQIKEDIEREYVRSGGQTVNLPQLPKEIGGEVDIMIGAKYLKYSPTEFFRLPSGLTIYQSMFVNADGGGRGVVCGPHPLFRTIMENANTSFFTNLYQIFRNGYQINPDIGFLSAGRDGMIMPPVDATDDDWDKSDAAAYFTICHYPAVRQIRAFEEAENAGSIITYRCVDCRGCLRCKKSKQIENASIEEELGKELIDESVTFNEETGRMEAVLPFLEDPVKKLAPNKDIAYKMYTKQVKALSKCEKDREDTIAAEAKLQRLGYVDYVSNLTPEQQDHFKNNPIQNFLPWFPVWSTNSVTTSCRPVFNASMPTATGSSMNDLLPAGTNNMNSLVEIVIRWSMHSVAIHTDIQQMYNSIVLKENYWCFQRYIWEETLDPLKIPVEKFVSSIIYGVRSSGNQAEKALRMTADMAKDTHPEIHRIIHEDLYADDCLTGCQDFDDAQEIADGMEEVLEKGKFYTKGFSFSKRAPNPDISKDGESISVAGMNWFTLQDKLQLNIKPINFPKNQRFF